MIGFGFEEAICNILTNFENLRQRMDLGSDVNEQTEPFHGGQTVAIANVMNRNYAHLRRLDPTFAAGNRSAFGWRALSPSFLKLARLPSMI